MGPGRAWAGVAGVPAALPGSPPARLQRVALGQRLHQRVERGAVALQQRLGVGVRALQQALHLMK